MSESMLVWGMALLGLAAILVIAELFIPTAGVLGITAGVVAVAGVVCMFRADALWGAISLLALLVLGPATAAFGLKIWPDTPLGRRIIGAPSDEEVERRRVEEEADRASRQSMVGKEGRVLTDLRPVGVIEIDGQRYDALSETLFIPAGARVRVTTLDGAQIKVRQA